MRRISKYSKIYKFYKLVSKYSFHLYGFKKYKWNNIKKNIKKNVDRRISILFLNVNRSLKLEQNKNDALIKNYLNSFLLKLIFFLSKKNIFFDSDFIKHIFFILIIKKNNFFFKNRINLNILKDTLILKQKELKTNFRIKNILFKDKTKYFSIKRKKQKYLKKKLLNKFVKFKDNNLYSLTKINFVKIGHRSSTRLKTYFKQSLQIKNMLQFLYDNSIKVNKKKFLKNISFKKQYLKKFLIKPQYKLDILLFFLNFFSSVYKSRDFIKKGFVVLNKNSKNINVLTRSGWQDIIVIGKNIYVNFFSYKKLKINSKKNRYFCSFSEIDYFSNSLVIVKDIKDLSDLDLTLICVEYFDINRLNNKALFWL